jgi:23S rRNA pseudouridine2605 synthase
MIDPIEGERLQAFLAHAGVASRRACEKIILQGRVSINGVAATVLGVRVKEGDLVELDGRTIGAERRKRYILLNKPVGYLSAMYDPDGRPLASDLIGKIPERVYNVGRLDQWSSGLLLFTNDGELASILGHPSGEIEKEYEIVADGELEPEFFEAFAAGIEIEGRNYRAVSIVRTGASSARIVLVEGRNREIRKVLERFGRKAKALRRIRIGPLGLGNLADGAYRELSGDEVESLRAFGRGRG